MLSRNGRQEDGLRCLAGLEITNIGQVGGCLRCGRDLISLCLGLGDLRLGEFDEALEDELYVCQRVDRQSSNRVGVYLNSGDIGVLRGVLVVVKTILGSLALSPLNTKFDKQEHNGFQRGDGAVAGALGGDMLVEDSQSRLLLVDCDELLRSLLSQYR